MTFVEKAKIFFGAEVKEATTEDIVADLNNTITRLYGRVDLLSARANEAEEAIARAEQAKSIALAEHERASRVALKISELLK